MIKLYRNIIFVFVLITSNWSFGQDVSFSQFYTNPLYLNPAFAGSIGVPRVALQYRNQWHSFSNAYNTYSASADFPVEKLRGGIGINFINDAQANGAINAYMVSAAYSVHLQLSENFRFQGGLQVAYNQNSLNVSDLVFADNLDANYGKHTTSYEVGSLLDPTYSFMDYSTGVLVYSKRVFFGLAAHHLNEPLQQFGEEANSDAKLNRKFTAHFGARLPVYLHGYNRKAFDITPQFILQSQGEFQQINYGMFAAKRGLAAGVWFRQNFGIRYDAVIFLVGFVRKKWQLTYSYDMTVSGLGGNSGGTSEVSLAFLLRNIKKGKALPFFDKYEEEFGEI